jgi:hypothetical protein
MEWTFPPGGRIREHLHPKQEESFSILEGEVAFKLDGSDRVASAGEQVVIPPGVRHAVGNTSDREARAVVEVTPALNIQSFFESVSGLARDGKTTKSAAPRNPLLMAVFAYEFRDEFQATFPRASCSGSGCHRSPRSGDSSVTGRPPSAMRCGVE